MKNNINKILSLVEEFLKVPSIIGFESLFLKYLNDKISKFEGDYSLNLNEEYLIIKPKKNYNKYTSFGKREKIIFSAHVDRHGFILNEDDEIEYLAYYLKKKNGLKFKRDIYDFYLSCGQRHTHDFIYSFDKNLGNINDKYFIERFNLDWKNKLVTFEVDKKINSNKDKLFMLNPELKLKDKYFFGQIDNVISVAVLVYLLEKNKIQNEIIFTTKEEIGFSYKNVLKYLNKIKVENSIKIITLDTSPYENFKDKKNGFLVLREGDENGSFDLDLINDLKKKLEYLGIPFYFKSSNNGMTELGRISSESKGVFNGATLQLPTLNYHTTYETATIESLENYLKIIDEINKTL